MARTIPLALLGSIPLASCIAPYTHQAARTFYRDYDCGNAVAAETLSGHYQVTGCGQVATYDCNDDGCSIYVEAVSSSSSQAPALDKKDLQRRREHTTLLSSDIRMETTDGKAVLLLEMRLDRSSYLQLSALPEERSDLLQIKVVRRETAEAAAGCKLEFLLDEQRRELPRTATVRDGYVLSQRIQVGSNFMNDLAVASKISFRACQQRWSLNGYQVQLVHDYLDRIEQEHAWKGKPNAARSAGLVPPSGGWPEWKSADSPPPAWGTQTAALDATTLFKTLSVSVFQVEAKRADSTSQGSAVAISATELLTNCHVLADARKIAIKQGKSEWPARIARADPASDRCVLAAPEAKLTPIASIRPYHALEVGETVYTLGSPVGLELTLSSGIISGRREEDFQSYIQTTAAISPGSSGGGLFDARGNLIGITTLALVGRERLNQALNFAIPADAFWQK
jgi:hypothetical protein